MGQILEEKAKEGRKQPHDKSCAQLYGKLMLDPNVRKEDVFITHKGEYITLSRVTLKDIYEESLIQIGGDHHSQSKWVWKLNTVINWNKVWEAVHNNISTNQTKSIIWQQIHLNFYTQFSYNKWHVTQNNCPLCQQRPQTIFHILLDCQFSRNLWDDAQPVLQRIHPTTVMDEEKAFGLYDGKLTKGMILRNWLTYILRDLIAQEERSAYHSGLPSIVKVKRNVNQLIKQQMNQKIIRYRTENSLKIFEDIFLHQGVLCEKRNEEYYIKEVYPMI